MTKTIARRKHHINNSHARPARRNLRHFDLSHKLDSLRGSLGQLTDNISDKTTDLLSKSLRSAKRQTWHVQKNVNRFVTKKPYHTLGIMAIAFLFLGFFLRRE